MVRLRIDSAFRPRSVFIAAPLLLLCIGLAGCNPKKQSTPAYAALPANSVNLTTFQGLSDPNWLTDDSGNLLTNAATISLAGVCSQGANSVVLQIDGTDVGSNPDCNSSGRVWTYSGAFAGADGVHTLIIYGKGKDGTLYASQQITQKVTKDTTPPVITGITSPSTTPYTTYSPNITISATVTGGLGSGTSTDSTGSYKLNKVVPSGSSTETFDFQTTLNDGETRTITFTVYDKAGNASSPVSVVIQYPGSFNTLTAPLSMYREPGISQPAPITSGTTILNNSGFTTIGTANSVTSVDGNFVIEPGLAPSMTQ